MEADELLKRYEQGERNFSNIILSDIRLGGGAAVNCMDFSIYLFMISVSSFYDNLISYSNVLLRVNLTKTDENVFSLGDYMKKISLMFETR